MLPFIFYVPRVPSILLPHHQRPNPPKRESRREEPEQTITEAVAPETKLSQMKAKGYIPAWSEFGVRWIKTKKE